MPQMYKNTQRMRGITKGAKVSSLEETTTHQNFSQGYPTADYSNQDYLPNQDCQLM